MNRLGAGNKGAIVARVVADGDQMADGAMEKRVDRFRRVMTDIDTDFGEGFDGLGPNISGDGTGAGNSKTVAIELAHEAFGHLAASGIGGANDENERLFHSTSIGEEELAAALEDEVEFVLAHLLFDAGQAGAFDDQVVAFGG